MILGHIIVRLCDKGINTQYLLSNLFFIRFKIGMKINFQPNINTSFKAIPLAKYGYLNDKAKDIIVYQLEKKDIDYLKYLSQNIDRFYEIHEIDNDSTRQVVKEAFDAGAAILSETKVKEDKAKVLMAFSNEEPSAVLIGNTLKTDKNGKFHYSSRKNHSCDETELDWLATWNKKILGEGKVIVCEYFETLLKDGFKQCYVRSEIPEKSFATEFYKKMGFKPLSERQRRIQRKNDNTYAIGNFDSPKDLIIPMKATTRDIMRTIKKRSRELMRKKLEPFSADLPHTEF